MKRLPITQKAKSSPFKFDYSFLTKVAGGVADSKEFIAAGQSIGEGMDDAARRQMLQNKVEQSNMETQEMREIAQGNNRPMNLGNNKKKNNTVTDSLPTLFNNEDKGGYGITLADGSKLAMGSKGVGVVKNKK